jgi:hypothetical protein
MVSLALLVLNPSEFPSICAPLRLNDERLGPVLVLARGGKKKRLFDSGTLKTDNCVRVIMQQVQPNHTIENGVQYRA